MTVTKQLQRKANIPSEPTQSADLTDTSVSEDPKSTITQKATNWMQRADNLEYATARSLRHLEIQQLQKLHGNTFAQRFLLPGHMLEPMAAPHTQNDNFRTTHQPDTQ